MGTATAILRRFLLAILWYAIGRVAEVVTTTWHLTRWEGSTNMLFFNWSQIKTGKQKGVLMPCAADGFAADFYHCLGCMFMVGYGQDQFWIFPGMYVTYNQRITFRVTFVDGFILLSFLQSQTSADFLVVL